MRKRFFPLEMVIALSLADLQEHLDNALRCPQGGTVGVSVTDQELDLVILVDPSQL